MLKNDYTDGEFDRFEREIAHTNYLHLGTRKAMEMIVKDFEMILSGSEEDLDNFDREWGILIEAMIGLRKMGFSDKDVKYYNGVLVPRVKRAVDKALDRAVSNFDDRFSDLLFAKGEEFVRMFEYLPEEYIRAETGSVADVLQWTTRNYWWVLAVALSVASVNKKCEDSLEEAKVEQDRSKVVQVDLHPSVVEREKMNAMDQLRAWLVEMDSRGGVVLADFFDQAEYILKKKSNEELETAAANYHKLDDVFDGDDPNKMPFFKFLKALGKMTKLPGHGAIEETKPLMTDLLNHKDKVGNCVARAKTVLSKIQQYGSDFWDDVYVQVFDDHIQVAITHKGKLYLIDGGAYRTSSFRKDIEGSFFVKPEDYFFAPLRGDADPEKVLKSTREAMKKLRYSRQFERWLKKNKKYPHKLNDFGDDGLPQIALPADVRSVSGGGSGGMDSKWYPGRLSYSGLSEELLNEVNVNLSLSAGNKGVEVDKNDLIGSLDVQGRYDDTVDAESLRKLVRSNANEKSRAPHIVHLNAVKWLDDEGVRVLSASDVYRLLLGGIEGMTVKQLKMLSNFEGEMIINAAVFDSDEKKKLIGSFKALTIVFRGLRELDKSIVLPLAKSNVRNWVFPDVEGVASETFDGIKPADFHEILIDLSGLKRIDADTFYPLVSVPGLKILNLNNLKSISSDELEFAMTRVRILRLRGVREINEAHAKVLLKYGGVVTGIEFGSAPFSDAVAEMLLNNDSINFLFGPETRKQLDRVRKK